MPSDGRRRAVVEAVMPNVDGGRFPIKRIIGDEVVVEADAFADGHDVVAVALRHRRAAGGWQEAPMAPLGNDRWRGAFAVEHLGRYDYAVAAWVDRWATWRRDLRARVDAGQDVAVDLLIGAELVDAAAVRAHEPDSALLAGWATELRGDGSTAARSALALDDELDALMGRRSPRAVRSSSPKRGRDVGP